MGVMINFYRDFQPDGLISTDWVMMMRYIRLVIVLITNVILDNGNY